MPRGVGMISNLKIFMLILYMWVITMPDINKILCVPQPRQLESHCDLHSLLLPPSSFPQLGHSIPARKSQPIACQQGHHNDGYIHIPAIPRSYVHHSVSIPVVRARPVWSPGACPEQHILELNHNIRRAREIGALKQRC